MVFCSKTAYFAGKLESSKEECEVIFGEVEKRFLYFALIWGFHPQNGSSLPYSQRNYLQFTDKNGQRKKNREKRFFFYDKIKVRILR